MSGFEPEDAPELVRTGLTPVVWTAQHVLALQQAAMEAGERVAVHLEIDTGMARQGVSPGPALGTVLDRLRRRVCYRSGCISATVRRWKKVRR